MTVSRRYFVYGLTILGLAPAAMAEPKDVPVENLFPYLKTYYSLPIEERTHFKLSYRFSLTGAGIDKFTAILNFKGQKIPLNFNTQGDILNLPTASALNDKTATVTLNAPKGTKFNLAMSIESSLKPEKTMDADALALSIAQAHKGSKKAAGIAAVAIPKFERITFKGAGMGQVELSDGTAKPLPETADGTPHFAPSDWPKAVRIVLDKAPVNLLIGPKIKA